MFYNWPFVQPMYGDWDEYRLTYHTYRGDLEYVMFREEISAKIKVGMAQ